MIAKLLEISNSDMLRYSVVSRLNAVLAFLRGFIAMSEIDA